VSLLCVLQDGCVQEEGRRKEGNLDRRSKDSLLRGSPPANAQQQPVCPFFRFRTLLRFIFILFLTLLCLLSITVSPPTYNHGPPAPSLVYGIDIACVHTSILDQVPRHSTTAALPPTLHSRLGLNKIAVPHYGSRLPPSSRDCSAGTETPVPKTATRTPVHAQGTPHSYPDTTTNTRHPSPSHPDSEPLTLTLHRRIHPSPAAPSQKRLLPGFEPRTTPSSKRSGLLSSRSRYVLEGTTRREHDTTTPQEQRGANH